MDNIQYNYLTRYTFFHTPTPNKDQKNPHKKQTHTMHIYTVCVNVLRYNCTNVCAMSEERI